MHAGPVGGRRFDGAHASQFEGPLPHRCKAYTRWLVRRETDAVIDDVDLDRTASRDVNPAVGCGGVTDDVGESLRGDAVARDLDSGRKVDVAGKIEMDRDHTV